MVVAFVGIGKGGGGVQHRPSISADDERQEQYPGWWISVTLIIRSFYRREHKSYLLSVYIDTFPTTKYTYGDILGCSLSGVQDV
jgi:hypothetical protein